MKNIVIIPTYNEKDNIPDLLKTVWDKIPDLHVLIVDDNSPDGTGAIIKVLQKQHGEKLFLLERQKKDGLGRAYVAGFKWALERGYTKLVEMDADFSHNPSVLPTILKELDSSAVVVGSRYIKNGGVENWSFFRKLLSIGGSFYSRMILGAPILDFTGGFNGWTSQVLQAIDLDTIGSQGYTFQIELKYRAFIKGFSIKETPIIFSERRAGQSKMSGKIVLEAIFAVWKLKYRNPNK